MYIKEIVKSVIPTPILLEETTIKKNSVILYK